jgi:methyl-accepting chemotaxis protein
LLNRASLAEQTPLGRSALLAAAILLSGACALGVHALTASTLAAAITLGIGALLASQGAALRLRADREQDSALAAASLLEATRDAQLQRTRVAEQLTSLADELAGAVAALEKEAQTQIVAVEETASLQANINESITAINREVESLTRANEESASSILELGSAVEQMAGTATTLQQTVESSTSSVHQMGVNIRQVAESTDSVQQMAQESAASITQMDRAIQEVGEHVRGASELTARVSQSAEDGSRAVGATIEGIARIREVTRESKSALEGLAERISEIGNIATVIGGISDETNLLSLNAAIIAAQAGAHGKAFAVVAEQVKTLARRTTASAKEIERLIADVQSRSATAMGAMGTGIHAVEEGVSRSRVAGEALEAIRISARDASGRVSEIARAAEEQARNSKHVADAARRTSEHVQQISTAMAEQSRAGDQLLQNATASLEMCRQMSHATEEQRASGRYITSNTESITELIRSILQSTRSHERASAGVGETFMALVESTHVSSRRIPEIGAAVARMRETAEALSAPAPEKTPPD